MHNHGQEFCYRPRLFLQTDSIIMAKLTNPRLAMAKDGVHGPALCVAARAKCRVGCPAARPRLLTWRTCGGGCDAIYRSVAGCGTCAERRAAIYVTGISCAHGLPECPGWRGVSSATDECTRLDVSLWVNQPVLVD